MKVTQMPLNAANLVANGGNIAYGVDVIIGLTLREFAHLSFAKMIRSLFRAIKTTPNSAYSGFAPRRWETALLCNVVSHGPGASLESAMLIKRWLIRLHCCIVSKQKN